MNEAEKIILKELLRQLRDCNDEKIRNLFFEELPESFKNDEEMQKLFKELQESSAPKTETTTERTFIVLTSLTGKFICCGAASRFASHLRKTHPRDCVWIRSEEEAKKILSRAKNKPELRRETFGQYLVYYYEHIEDPECLLSPI